MPSSTGGGGGGAAAAAATPAASRASPRPKGSRSAISSTATATEYASAGGQTLGTADRMVQMCKASAATGPSVSVGAEIGSGDCSSASNVVQLGVEDGDVVLERLRDELIPVEHRGAYEEFTRQLAAPPLLQCNRDYQQRYQAIRKKLKVCPRKAQLNFLYRSLLLNGEVARCEALEEALVAKGVRSLSGVLVITVFTSAYPKVGNKVQRFSCRHNCYYCPNEPGLPRSYLSEEPGVARGKRHNWDPVDQFYARAWTYFLNGHPIDKVELLVLGGTWSEYPPEYQEEFLRDIFWSANTFFDARPKRARLSLEEEQVFNETARVRLIGLTLETRPDSITREEIRRLRQFGCTRVQLGIQHTNDAILKKINRGCTTADACRAVRLLKDACFKIDFHLMPDLPGSTPELDMQMFNEVLFSEDLQADQWKIYPCEVVPWTVIEKWFREGSYKPYPDSVLQELLVRVKARVHPWLRLNRVIRDIPNQYIMGGNSVTNLRQVLQQRLKDRGQSCKCIRCRELRNQRLPQGVEVRLFQREYASSGGRELFLSFETTDEKIICGFLRLRLSRGAGLNGCFPELDGAALVRELHVYGKMRPVGSDRASASGGGSTHAQQQKHPGPTDEYLVGSAPGAKARRRRRKAAAAAAAKRKSLGPASGTAVETHSASADSAVLSSQKKSAANAPSRSDRQHAGLGRRLMRRAEELASEAGYTRLAVISGIGTRDYYRHLGFRLEGTYMVKDLAAEATTSEAVVVANLFLLFLGAMAFVNFPAAWWRWLGFGGDSLE